MHYTLHARIVSVGVHQAPHTNIPQIIVRSGALSPRQRLRIQKTGLHARLVTHTTPRQSDCVVRMKLRTGSHGFRGHQYATGLKIVGQLPRHVIDWFKAHDEPLWRLVLIPSGGDLALVYLMTPRGLVSSSHEEHPDELRHSCFL